MRSPRSWLAAVVLLGCVPSLFGAEKTNLTPTKSPVEAILIQESEAPSTATDRRELLTTLRDATDDPAIWWQSGFVQSSDGWQLLDTLAPETAESLRRYQLHRNLTKTDAAGQLELADWCRDAGLRDQERAHLTNVLLTRQVKNPVAVLQRLGYRLVGSHWYTDTELKAATDEAARLAKEWKRLSPRLETLFARLEGKPAARKKALEELRLLTTPASIPVLEFTLGLHSETAANAVVDVLRQIDSYRASQSLARLAVGSPWDSVRASAASELKERPLEDFVPAVLELMHMPIELKLEEISRSPEIGPQMHGDREWRFLFQREGRDVIEVAALRVIYHRRGVHRRHEIPNAPINNQALLLDTSRQSLDDYQRSLEAVDQVNDADEYVNQRVGALLHAISDQPADASPAQWWDWWDGHTQTVSPGDKDVVIVSEETSHISASYRVSCLAAGTPIRTEDGFRPIEQIQVGDRVLSKNIETGELRYQPVLRTTRRENAPLMNVTVGDETIAASLGHNFWISGRGWTRVNQLETGLPAHTATGTLPISITDAERKADVYNLVVADFHTYFVGESLLLGHDVTTPSPTDVVVPGLAAAK